MVVCLFVCLFACLFVWLARSFLYGRLWIIFVRIIMLRLSKRKSEMDDEESDALRIVVRKLATAELLIRKGGSDMQQSEPVINKVFYWLASTVPLRISSYMRYQRTKIKG